MAGYQYAHSSPLSIRSNSILNSSMFYAWCVNVMQSVPGCGTVCRRWIVIALYPIDIRARGMCSMDTSSSNCYCIPPFWCHLYLFHILFHTPIILHVVRMSMDWSGPFTCEVPNVCVEETEISSAMQISLCVVKKQQKLMWVVHRWHMTLWTLAAAALY